MFVIRNTNTGSSWILPPNVTIPRGMYQRIDWVKANLPKIIVNDIVADSDGFNGGMNETPPSMFGDTFIIQKQSSHTASARNLMEADTPIVIPEPIIEVKPIDEQIVIHEPVIEATLSKPSLIDRLFKRNVIPDEPVIPSGSSEQIVIPDSDWWDCVIPKSNQKERQLLYRLNKAKVDIRCACNRTKLNKLELVQRYNKKQIVEISQGRFLINPR